MREMQGLPPLPVCSAPVNMADFSIFIVVFSERAMRASAAYRPVKSYFKSCKDSSAVQDSSAPGMGFSRSGWSSPGLLSSHQDGRQRPSATVNSDRRNHVGVSRCNGGQLQHGRRRLGDILLVITIGGDRHTQQFGERVLRHAGILTRLPQARRGLHHCSGNIHEFRRPVRMLHYFLHTRGRRGGERERWRVPVRLVRRSS